MKAQNIPKQHEQYKTSTTTFLYYSSLSQILITGKAENKTFMSCLPDEDAEEDEEGSLDPQSEDAVHVGHLHG